MISEARRASSITREPRRAGTASKQGDLYVLDRASGKPLGAGRKMRAPGGGLEPDGALADPDRILVEYASKPDLTESRHVGDVADRPDGVPHRISDGRLSRLLHTASARQITVQYPGYNGGSDWGGLSIDPVREIAIANYNDMPNYVRLVPRAEANKEGIVPRFASQKLSLRSHRIDPQCGRALRRQGQCGLAHAVHQAHVQASALWRHPGNRHCQRQDPVGPSDRDGSKERPVRHPDDAALDHRNANNGGAVDTGERPHLHRRGDRWPASSRSTRAPARFFGLVLASRGRTGEPDDLHKKTAVNIW